MYTYQDFLTPETSFRIREMKPIGDLILQLMRYQQFRIGREPHGLNPVWFEPDDISKMYEPTKELIEDDESQPYNFPEEVKQMRDTLTPSQDEDIAAFNLRAWQKMKPKLSQGFSIVNFLLELKDFKFIFKSLKSGKALSQLKDWIFSRETMTFQGLSKKVAEGHLTWSFAIAPLVSDLQKMYKILVNSEEIIQRYVSGGDGLAHVRRYSNPKEWTKRVKINFPSDNPLVKEHLNKMSIQRTYKPGKITACSVYKYSAPALKGLLAYITSFLDLLGANRNPAIIWNAIPFSFVVDWFFQVGDYLDTFETQVFGDNYPTLLDFLFSEKYEIVDEFYYDSNVVARAEYKVYDRQKMKPPEEVFSLGNIQLADFSVQKLLLGTSLARCQFKR
jgi:hypothetical protein